MSLPVGLDPAIYETVSRLLSKANDSDRADLESAFSLLSWNAYELGAKHGGQMEAGYLEAGRIAAPSAKRRSFGRATDDRITKAAQEFRHLSKEDAAFEIADVVRRSPSFVRRRLIKLFPGADWKK